MASVVRQMNRETGELESVETMLKRFKKQVLKDDILYECKIREHFMNPAEKRREKAKRAKIRNLKKIKKY